MEPDYRSLFENHPDAMLYTDVSGKVLACNMAAIETMGDVTGGPIPLTISDGRASLKRRIAAIARCHCPASFAVVLPDGTKRLARCMVHEDEDDDGETVGIWWHLLDADARCIKLLDDYESMWTSFVDNAPIGMFLLEAPEGRIVQANREAARLTGYPKAELVGKTYMDFVDPDLISRLSSSPFGHIDRVGKVSDMVFPVETTHGRRFVAVDAVSLGNGRYLVYGRDHTDLVETTRRLVESEQTYRSLVESSPVPILVHAEGKVLYTNPAAVKVFGGSSSRDLEGKDVLDLVHPDFVDMVRDHIQRLYAYNELLDPMEEILLKLDGTPFHALVAASPAFFDGKQAGQVVFLDITDLKRMQEEKQRLQASMQQAQKLESLGVLAGGIAHDFNNFLSGMLGSTELAILELGDDFAVKQHLEEVKRTAIQASDLCRQLLAYSGRGRFMVQPLDLSRVIREMRQLLDVSVDKKAVLLLDLDDDLPAIEADVSQIRQVVLNLVLNASEALGGKKGTIRVTTGVIHCTSRYLASTYLGETLPEGEYVYLEVSDTGCGMDEGVKRRLFDPFFSTKFAGRGLGLAATLGIVRGHRGTIKVYSEEGKGTTIKILFPTSERAARTPKQWHGPERQWRGSGTILVVDDDSTVRRVLSRMLQRLGFDVLSATNGREGVEFLKEHGDGIDLVILDMTMPELSGKETFRLMREIHPDVKVLLTSGYNEQDTISKFAGKGLAGFLQKPVSMAALTEKMKALLGVPGRRGG